MASTTMESSQDAHQLAEKLSASIRSVMVGADDAVSVTVMALLAQGHILVEGAPGVGKTVLGKSLARSISGSFRRIQCTADLLPADITGTNVFDPRDREFHFRPGPIFSHVVLVDEINRAPPRTQSAFLESLEEHQVTVDGVSHPVPDPFIVIATLNPALHIGTFPLPETELDRFVVTARLEYASEEDEAEIASRQLVEHPVDRINAETSIDDVLLAQRAVKDVYADPKLIRYVASVVGTARRHPSVLLGPSTRATMAILNLARAHALLDARDFATLDDVKAVVHPALAHRISPGGADQSKSTFDIIEEILRQAPWTN